MVPDKIDKDSLVSDLENLIESLAEDDIWLDSDMVDNFSKYFSIGQIVKLQQMFEEYNEEVYECGDSLEAKEPLVKYLELVMQSNIRY